MEKNENGYSEYMMRPPRISGRGEGGCVGQSSSTPPSLAMVYSPEQSWRMIYTPEDALSHGTLFEELYKPLEDCYGK